MLLKKLTPLFAFFLLTTPGLHAGFLNGNDLHSQEIVIQYSAENGYLHIMEYNIRTLKKSKEDIEAQTAQMIEDAQNKQFCQKRFPLEAFTSLQEEFRVKDRMLVGEYRLMTRESDALEQLKAIMNEILEQKVGVEETEQTIILLFEKKDFEPAAGSNAIGPMDRLGKTALFWRSGTRNFQLVFNTGQKGKPIRKYFPDEIGSPKLTQEEIIGWRDE